MITKQSIADAPSTTGLYVFKSGSKILYIGKSINIKARLNSHLENARLDRKEYLIVNNSDSVETIPCENEFKAILLEAEMIRKIKPKYNSAWKDHKSLLYIEITAGEEFPKVLLTRRPDRQKSRSRFFGPFSNVRETSNLVADIRKIVPFCTQKKISRSPCFYSKIHQCSPCPNYVSKLPDGAERRTLKRNYRRNIRKVIAILEGQTTEMIGAFMKEMRDLTARQDFEEAIKMRNRIFRLERLSHFDLETQDIFSNRTEEYLRKSLVLFRNYFPGLRKLERIEGYDISNLGFDNPVASMVVLHDGVIDKKEYRRFKLKGKNRSDFERIREVLTRRFRQQWPLPDLVMIDGGRPQVKSAREVLDRVRPEIPVVGLAKNPDRYVLGIPGMPTVRPGIDDPGFNLLRLLRDESHRFARKYHLFLRERDFLI